MNFHRVFFGARDKALLIELRKAVETELNTNSISLKSFTIDRLEHNFPFSQIQKFSFNFSVSKTIRKINIFDLQVLVRA